MPWIRGFVWDDENVAHVARHLVDPGEVEEALSRDPVVVRAPDARYLGYGTTIDGRLLFCAFSRKPRGRIRVITAREMTPRERRRYRRWRRRR